MVEPNGYEGFAAIYNHNKGDNPCEFILRKPETGLYNYDSFPIPQSVLTFPVVDNCYSKFRAFGIIKPDGEVNQEAWASMKNALLRPHCKAIRNQARSDSRHKEKELKKHCFEDAKADVFGLPTSSRTNSNKKKRAQKDTATSESSKGDKEMPIDQFIEKKHPRQVIYHLSPTIILLSSLNSCHRVSTRNPMIFNMFTRAQQLRFTPSCQPLLSISFRHLSLVLDTWRAYVTTVTGIFFLLPT
ncbi:hypothetical protein J132_08907 [Termitomyces sp. J132]|nr:hypothetical protein H2248_004407 [Termitomyces sp. 'cryptogamus']KNZ82019.1 hypothetical protein J132_08907 [Termitomyces sp. J132]